MEKVKTPQILLHYRLFFQFLSYSASIIKDIHYSTVQKKPNRERLTERILFPFSTRSAHVPVPVLYPFHSRSVSVLYLFHSCSVSILYPFRIHSVHIPYVFCIHSISILYPYHSRSHTRSVSVPFPFEFPVRFLLISTVHPDAMPLLWLLTALTVLSKSASVMFKKHVFPKSP